MRGTRGLMWCSMYLERLSVGQSQPGMIGRPGILGLSSLGKRQNRGVSGVEETCRWCSQCDRCLSCDRGIV